MGKDILKKLGNLLVEGLAALWYRLDRRHREIARRNLAFAYGEELTPGERERVARGVFRHFIRFAGEMVVLLVAPFSYLRKRVVIVGDEHYLAALEQGRGVVSFAVHSGNWEYTVMGLCLNYRRVAVVARELDHPLARRLARYMRERGGNWMVNKQRGLRDILSHLKANRIVGIVIDQNTTDQEGVLADFFGRPARTTPVAALLARRGIPVVPSLSRRLPDGRHLMIVFPPLPCERTRDAEADIRRHLTLQNQWIEAWVRAEPSQWLWMHRRWKNQFPQLYKDL